MNEKRSRDKEAYLWSVSDMQTMRWSGEKQMPLGRPNPSATTLTLPLCGSKRQTEFCSSGFGRVAWSQP